MDVCTHTECKKTLGTPAFSMTYLPGENYDPYLMSLAKSILNSVDEGAETG
jgi:hypothetical protein